MTIIFKCDPIDRLLEEDNSSFRYFTLMDILERPQNDPEVIEARENIMKMGVVPKILVKTGNWGYWVFQKIFILGLNIKELHGNL